MSNKPISPLRQRIEDELSFVRIAFGGVCSCLGCEFTRRI